MNIPDYQIVLFNSLLQEKYKNWFQKEMPNCLLFNENTGSILIKRLGNFNPAIINFSNNAAMTRPAKVDLLTQRMK